MVELENRNIYLKNVSIKNYDLVSRVLRKVRDRERRGQRDAAKIDGRVAPDLDAGTARRGEEAEDRRFRSSLAAIVGLRSAGAAQKVALGRSHTCNVSTPMQVYDIHGRLSERATRRAAKLLPF